jgi:PilZ domain
VSTSEDETVGESEATDIEKGSTEDEGTEAVSEAGTDEGSETQVTGEAEAETVEADSEEAEADEPSEVETKADGEAETVEAVSDATEESESSEAETETDGEGEPVEAASKDPEDEDSIPESERRQAARKGVKLSRLISSRIIDGESQRDCYLHLVDISDGGFRINSDDPFPEDRDFILEIGLAPFGNELATRAPRQAFPVKTVWTKSLVGGMVVSGLAFQNLDEKGMEIVEAIMQGASPQGRRMHFRLNRVLGVELGRSEEEQQWLYPLTLDLSVEGMRICLSEPLEVGETFPIKVFLEFELPTVNANAEVMWQETMPSGRVQVGLKFDGISERDAMAIKTYIDQCLRQDESHRRS